MSAAFPFLRLPLELREAVYSLYFNPASRLVDGEFGGGQYRFEFDLYRVNKQVYSEAENVFRRENVFVRIDTPWPTAVNHISQDGLVPIVAAGLNGKKFRRYHQLVEISAPVHSGRAEHVIVVLLDDLHLFCQVWFYSALSYPDLNDNLCTNFLLQDPYFHANPKPIPLSLQRRLLLPFEKVKGLWEIEINGYDERVKQELLELMAKPNDTVQKCCEDCAEFMESGDCELAEGNADQALELYIQAFRSIHIIITGRTRRVLGDPFFHDVIEAGRFAGQTGTTVRIILRIKLVSRAVKTYLKLQQWEEAAFWGIRSIRIMREPRESEFEGFLTEFVGAKDVGLLYLRTAIAMRKMEEKGSEQLSDYVNEKETSKQLFPLTAKYLKGKYQRVIKKELNESGVRVSGNLLVLEKITGEGSDVDSMRHMNQEDTDVEMEIESS
ncbi:hypothetical protein K505DRAFT_314239 [Melanomma pulvis-pyrius CBS 109.77]|uniref:Uncharacterized protein n=1 Tax=Melanomma pulvis-pyrius CBS 109.77 TaxID=1314802 RepID=A0A6A6WYJ6_9PLEO|nr:hypothetical protein K505DRAFT_314239 [Melanomma pulvis-pyrius CBS 109.77]